MFRKRHFPNLFDVNKHRGVKLQRWFELRCGRRQIIEQIRLKQIVPVKCFTRQICYKCQYPSPGINQEDAVIKKWLFIQASRSFMMLVSIPDHRHSCPPRRLVSLGCCFHWIRLRECP